MKNLCCLLEEPSARCMLEGVLPRLLPSDIVVSYIVFEGKQDLERNVEKKLRLWQKPETSFLVMRDKDSGDCIQIKSGLMNKVKASGKSEVTIVRIACFELESFYLGDLLAVEQGLNLSGVASQQRKRKYQTPDDRANATQELEFITSKRYQKIAGSRAIAPFLKVDGSNFSHSFNVLLSGVRGVMGIEECCND